MAFLYNRVSSSSLLLSHSLKAKDLQWQSSRGVHIEPGLREKAHPFPYTTCYPAAVSTRPALDRFKSYTKSVSRLKRIGDALTVAVVAGCCYEIYVKAVVQEDVRKQAGNA